MAQLPRFDPTEVATKSDLVELSTGLADTRSDVAELAAATKSDVAQLRGETKSDFANLRGELRDGVAAVNQRLDRLFLTLLVAMFGIVASLISLVFTVS
ncbi:MAG: hypothetical protein ACLFVZ_10520 [Actinomycetota bacterium]